MRIALPTTSFPRREGDPSGAFVLGMARALAARGHEIVVLAPEPASGSTWRAPCPGVRVEWVRYARPRGLSRTFHRAGAPDNLARDPLAWIGAATFPPALARALATCSRERPLDAIASHWGVPSGLVAGALRGAARHVAIFHSADVHALAALPRPIGARLARAVAARANALVFVSEHLHARFAALAPGAALERAHVIPMGVEPPPAIARADARAALGLRRFTVLAMSRLVPIKGLERAITAAHALDVELAIAGEGPERARLERLAAGRARFLGTIAGAEKARWLAASDALVIPSRALASGRAEGAPTAVMEAMAAGLPIVATASGGLAELVGDAGLVVPDTSDDRCASALRAAIARLASDEALHARLASASRARGGEHTWPVLAPRFEALLAGDRDPHQGSMRRAAAGGRNANTSGGTRAFSS